MDWLNKFMIGKKKYSASVILPIAIAVINTMVADKEMAQTLIGLVQEYLPTLVSLFGGIAYAVMEGLRDKELAKNKVPEYAMFTVPQSQGQPSPEPSNQVPPQLQQYEPTFNAGEFHKKVEVEVANRGMEMVPASLVLCAEKLGRDTPAANPLDTISYWQYYRDLVEDSLNYYENQRDEKGCLKHGEQVFMLRATFRTAAGVVAALQNNREAFFSYFWKLPPALRTLHNSASFWYTGV